MCTRIPLCLLPLRHLIQCATFMWPWTQGICCSIEVLLVKISPFKFSCPGDYEFLCYMYGLSGATGTFSQTSLEIKFEKCSSGRHRCLWCLIASDPLITPRQQHAPRTLQGIQADYARFFASGGELKNAKHYNITSLT